MTLSGKLAALRIARREVRRALGRSALVVALVGLPVAGLGFGAVAYDSFTLTPAETAARTFGTADAAVQMLYDEPVTQWPHQLHGTPTDPGSEPALRPHTKRELLAVLPAGTRLYPHHRGSGVVRTAHGIAPMVYRGLDYAAPIAEGMLTPLAGRAPRGDHEVALTRAAAERIGARVGGVIRVVEPTPARYQVVGLVEDPGTLDLEQVVFPADAMPEGSSEEASWLADTPRPLSWADVRALNQEGMTAVSRAVLLDPPPASEVPADPGGGGGAFGVGAVLVGMAVLEIVLLAGPAFAISARRRQRELALVAAAGGTPSHVRWIVLADGVVLGGLGAAVGLVLGIAGAAAAVPLLETELFGRRIGGLRVFPLAQAGIAGLAVLTGLLAALVPAFVAARQDVVAGLSGRRGATRSKRRWVAVGLVVTALGGTAAVYGTTSYVTELVLAGLVVGQLGLVMCMPALIGAVGMLGGRLPLPARMALRTTSRNRGAAAPAIAAVMAAVAAAVTVAMIEGAVTERQISQYQATTPEGYLTVALADTAEPEAADAVAAAVRRTMPVVDVRVVRTGGCTTDDGVPCWVEPVMPERHRCPLGDGVTRETYQESLADPRCAGTELWSNSNLPMPLVDDGSGLPAMTGADAGDVAAATRVLRDGGAVVADPRYLVGGQVTVSVMDPNASGTKQQPSEITRVRVPGYVLDSGVLWSGALVIGDPLAERLELDPRPAAVAAATSRTPTQAEEDAASGAIRDIGGELHVERGPQLEHEPFLLVLALIAGLITLGAAAIATGLVLTDSRRELGTLAAVGAAPRLRRLLTLAQSGVISGLGTLVGAAVGVGAATVMLLAMNSELAERTPYAARFPYAVPWQVLAITVVVVPLIAMLGAGLLTRSRLPVERRPT